MTTIDGTYELLARRARRLSALAAAAWVALSVSVLGLALGIPGKLLGWPIVGVPGVSLALAAIAAVVAYELRRRQSIDMASTLLRADDGLATDARLSTLYTIRDRQDLRTFAVRIAAGLSSRPLLPRIALPVTQGVVLPLLAAAAVAVATLVTLAALPSPRVAPPRFPSPAHVSPLDEASARRAEASQPDAAAAPLERADERRGADASASKAPSTSSAPEASLDTGDLPTRPQSGASLEDTLRAIEARIAADQEAQLTESEIAQLESLAGAAPTPLADAVRDLLASSTRDQALARVQSILARPDVAESPPARRDATPEAPSVLKPAVAVSGPEEETASGQTPGPAGGQEAASSAGKYPFFEEAGGPAEITLVGSRLPTTIGTAGEFSYYVTKSVPVEPPTADPTAPAGAPLSLSFERATSIAAERSLPGDVLEVVRTYFTQITEGGP